MQTVAEKCMCPDNQVQRPKFQRFVQLAFLLRPRGAGEESDLQPERRQKRAQCAIMLLCKNLGRRHEGGGISCPEALPDEGCGDKCLAAADIALEKAAHAAAGGQIRRGFLNRPPLGCGRGEGKCVVKQREIGFRNDNALLPGLLPASEGTGEEKQLFKDKALSRLIQCMRVRRKMNILVRLPGIRQTVLFPYGRGQKFGKTAQAAVQPLPDTLSYGALLQPADHAVDRDNPAGDGHAPGGEILRLKDRIGQAPAGPFDLHLPIKAVALPASELILHITLVEPGDGHFRTVVKGAYTYQVEAAADAGEAGLVGNHGRDADRFAVLHQRDGPDAAAVLIAPGEIGDEIEQRKDAELVQSLRPLLSDPPDTSYVSAERFHYDYSAYLTL